MSAMLKRYIRVSNGEIEHADRVDGEWQRADVIHAMAVGSRGLAGDVREAIAQFVEFQQAVDGEWGMKNDERVDFARQLLALSHAAEIIDKLR